MARILVVGANGFLGAPLTRALAGRGHEVTAFDRFSRGTAAVRADNVRVMVGDFFNRSDVAAALRGQEHVFHFLSTTTPAAAEGDPLLDLTTNVAPSVELMRLAVEAGVSRVYFASSGGTVYGDRGRESYSESDSTEPVSPYGIGKLAIENYLGYFGVKHGLQSVIFRISNPYGPGQAPRRRQGLIPIVLARLRDELPIMKLGDGSMVRDYVYLDDLISMIVAVVQGQPRHTIYNLGSGYGHTVNSVLETIAQVTGLNPVIKELPKPATFVERVVLDTDRYTCEFGAPDLISLDTGIAMTWRGLG